MKTIFNCYSYARLSSAKQKRTSVGATRQLEKAEEICKENGWKLSPKTFQDLGVSAFRGKNRLKGALAEFIRLADEKRLESNPCLLIEQWDRWSRQDLDESETALTQLLKSGVAVHVAFIGKTYNKESVNTLSDRIEIMVALKSAFEFSANLSKRVKDAGNRKLTRVQAGEVVRHHNVPKYLSWNPVTRKYEHNDKTPLVAEMVNDYLSGQSLHGISAELNSKRIPSIRSKRFWSPKTIKAILSNRILLGEFLGQKNYAEPITTPDKFERIQKLLARNKSNKGKVAETVNILKGLVFCKCGERMNILTNTQDYRNKKKYSRNFRYYRCSSVHRKPACDFRKVMPTEPLELDLFLSYLQQSPGDILRNQASKPDKSAISLLQSKLVKLDKDVAECAELVGALPMAELKEKLQKLESQRQKIKTELDKLNLESANISQAPQALKSIKSLLVAMGYKGERKETPAYARAVERIQRHLENPATRMQMRQHLPDVISGIILDTNAKQYAVKNLAGIQSGWRSVAK